MDDSAFSPHQYTKCKFGRRSLAFSLTPLSSRCLRTMTATVDRGHRILSTAHSSAMRMRVSPHLSVGHMVGQSTLCFGRCDCDTFLSHTVLTVNPSASRRQVGSTVACRRRTKLGPSVSLASSQRYSWIFSIPPIPFHSAVRSCSLQPFHYDLVIIRTLSCFPFCGLFPKLTAAPVPLRSRTTDIFSLHRQVRSIVCLFAFTSS